MNKILLTACMSVVFFSTINSAYAIDAKYRAKLEHSGCTQVSEMQGCDINKTKAENAKAGFGTTTASNEISFSGQWVAKNADSGQTVANIRVDKNDTVWVNGKQVRAKKSDGALLFKQGTISYTIYGFSPDRKLSSWYDSDAQTSGPIRQK